jgi:hypothetical protein
MSQADDLRRKIALYREYLAMGADLDLASIYLRQITRLETELGQIEAKAEAGDDQQSSPQSASPGKSPA